jgi:TolB-like protein
VVLAFDDYRLDIARRELRRGSALIKLEPKAFDLLAYLVRNRHRVVSKEEILQNIWNGRLVSESALTTRINAARSAIGDDGKTQTLLRTYVRSGYRFVGYISELPDGATPVTSRASPQSEKPLLAIRSFQNLSDDHEQDNLVDGIVEEIRTAIVRLPWLSVIARDSSFVGNKVDTKQVAHELGVRYVLDGSVRKAGKRTRIAGQLIDATTNTCIWAGRFDASLDDIFELQDRAAIAFASGIEPKLRLAEIERARRKPSQNLDAYDLYLRAQAHVFKRTEESMAESVRAARNALEIDSSYAPAMARLALSQTMRRNRHWIKATGPEVEEAICMARQAIAGAANDPWVLDFAGLTLSSLASANEAALGALERATILNPNFALAFGHRGLILAYLNRPKEAILSVREAIRLSPFDPGRFSFCEALSLAHLAIGRYHSALRWAEEGLSENSGMPALRLKLSLCGHLGRVEEARECQRQVADIYSESMIAGLIDDMPKGLAPEIVNRIIEGLRKAGVPDA